MTPTWRRAAAAACARRSARRRQAWKEDKEGYQGWLKEKIANRPERSHGFRFRGQYEEQVPDMLKIAKER